MPSSESSVDRSEKNTTLDFGLCAEDFGLHYCALSYGSEDRVGTFCINTKRLPVQEA
jgi:hypothetical protein